MHSISTLRPFLAAFTLAGLTACSKEPDVSLLPAASASYKLDGKLITCNARQFVTRYGDGNDNLTVYLYTTPELTIDRSTVIISFRKPSGAALSTYQPTAKESLTRGRIGSYGIEYSPATITQSFLHGGTVSGTFSGEARSCGTDGKCPVYSTITEGVFSNVQPE